MKDQALDAVQVAGAIRELAERMMIAAAAVAAAPDDEAARETARELLDQLRGAYGRLLDATQEIRQYTAGD